MPAMDDLLVLVFAVAGILIMGGALPFTGLLSGIFLPGIIGGALLTTAIIKK